MKKISIKIENPFKGSFIKNTSEARKKLNETFEKLKNLKTGLPLDTSSKESK